MSERPSNMLGIAENVATRHKRKDFFLDNIDRLVDRKPLERVLCKKRKSVVNVVGNPA